MSLRWKVWLFGYANWLLGAAAGYVGRGYIHAFIGIVLLASIEMAVIKQAIK